MKAFGQIRSKLLIRKKFTRYVLYAIGEIFLIVVGILIAVQIGNWNESRKNKETSEYYLESLKTEFTDNDSEARYCIAFHEMQVKYSTDILQFIDGESSSLKPEELHCALLLVGWALTPNFRHDAWSELVSTGKVGLIENDSLRELITSFHADVNGLINLEQELSQFNLRYRYASGNVVSTKLRLAIAEVVGRLDISGPIKEPLLSEQQLRKRLNQIENIGTLLSDIVIARKSGLFLSKKLAEKNARILEMLRQATRR